VKIYTLEEKFTRLSENSLKSTPISVLFLPKPKYPRLSENLCSLGRKATRLSENAPENTLFCLRRSCSG